MNKVLTLLLVAGMVPAAFAESTGGGGNTASVTVPACAVVYAPVSIGEVGPWNFGTLVLNTLGQKFSVYMDKHGAYSNWVNCSMYNGNNKVPTDVPTIIGIKDPRLQVCFTTPTTVPLKGGFLSGTLTLTPDPIPSTNSALFFFKFPLTGTLSGNGWGVGSYTGSVMVTACYM